MTAGPTGSSESIPGYNFGQPEVGRSPVSLDDLRQLEQTVGWTEQDVQVLYQYRENFKNHAEEMVDAWRAVIGSQPHLAQWFVTTDGKPDEGYKARVKKRFVQWVADVCFRPHDQAWLDYQEEIGLRHTPTKKNQTDGGHTPSLVPLRYLIAFVPIVTTGLGQFFTKEVSKTELRKLEKAWAKSVQLHVTLWSRPYVKDGWW